MWISLTFCWKGNTRCIRCWLFAGIVTSDFHFILLLLKHDHITMLVKDFSSDACYIGTLLSHSHVDKLRALINIRSGAVFATSFHEFGLVKVQSVGQFSLTNRLPRDVACLVLHVSSRCHATFAQRPKGWASCNLTYLISIRFWGAS